MENDFSYVMTRELLPDETLLWCGKPNPAVLFSKADIFAIPFSVIWCAFAIFWMVSAFSVEGSFGFFCLFGIPFVAVGLYIVFGRFYLKIRRKKRTIYAITNKRVLVVRVGSGGERKSLASAGLININNETLDKRSGGNGSILFGSIPYYVGYYLNTGMDVFLGSRANHIIAFFDIDDVDTVFEIYRNAKYPRQ